MSEELKPCPFCGGEADTQCTAPPHSDWFVLCRNCGASAPIFNGDKLDGWNLRAACAAQAVDEENESLAAEVTYYRSTLRNVLKDIRDDIARGGLAPSWGGVAETIAVVLNNDRAALAAPVLEDEGYPPCDYCGITPDYHPWHGSGLLNGTTNKYIHACDACRSKLPAHAPLRAVRLPERKGPNDPGSNERKYGFNEALDAVVQLNAQPAETPQQ